jgi:hypothetical protein
MNRAHSGMVFLLLGACLLPGACSGSTFKSTGGAGGNVGTGGASAEDAIPPGGLLLWLRSDRGVTQDLNSVAIWANQAPDQGNAIQSAINARPALVSSGIGELPVIAFDGVDDFLKLPDGYGDFSQGLSMFAVINKSTIPTCDSVLEFSNGSEIDDISFGQYQDQMAYEVLYNVQTEEDVLPTDVPQLMSVVHRPNLTVELHRNGSLASSGSFDLPDNVMRQQNFVGQTLYDGCTTFAGQIGELLVFNRAVSDVELLKIEIYLRNRWSCCSN